MEKETIVKYLEDLVATAEFSIKMATDARVDTEFFEGKLAAYRLVLDTVK